MRGWPPSFAFTSLTQALAMARTGSFLGMKEMARNVCAPAPVEASAPAKTREPISFSARIAIPSRLGQNGGFCGCRGNLFELRRRRGTASRWRRFALPHRACGELGKRPRIGLAVEQRALQSATNGGLQMRRVRTE